MNLSPVHPFPARMSPDLALAALRDLAPNSRVLDPMCGSGTVLRYAGDLDHFPIGADIDPLAVLMARVWTKSVDPGAVLDATEEVVAAAEALPIGGVHLPWIDNDPETSSFVDYWFGEAQQRDLRRLALVLREDEREESDFLKVALSRIVVTKDRGASLARDVSHSRPHRVAESSDYEVLPGFKGAVMKMLRALESSPPKREATVFRQDARNVFSVRSGSIDCVLTSPPYLNAIDYMRGHRMALVWLGHRLLPLRQIRADNVGAERGVSEEQDAASARPILDALPWWGKLTPRYRRIFHRYVCDLRCLAREIWRVLTPEGRVVMVVGNSTLKGVFVRTSEAVRLVLQDEGFHVLSEEEREIPPSRRYLPPPRNSDSSALKKRMRAEVILTAKRSMNVSSSRS